MLPVQSKRAECIRVCVCCDTCLNCTLPRTTDASCQATLFWKVTKVCACVYDSKAPLREVVCVCARTRCRSPASCYGPQSLWQRSRCFRAAEAPWQLQTVSHIMTVYNSSFFIAFARERVNLPGAKPFCVAPLLSRFCVRWRLAWVWQTQHFASFLLGRRLCRNLAWTLLPCAVLWIQKREIPLPIFS